MSTIHSPTSCSEPERRTNAGEKIGGVSTMCQTPLVPGTTLCFMAKCLVHVYNVRFARWSKEPPCLARYRMEGLDLESRRRVRRHGTLFPRAMNPNCFGHARWGQATPSYAVQKRRLPPTLVHGCPSKTGTNLAFPPSIFSLAVLHARDDCPNENVRGKPATKKERKGPYTQTRKHSKSLFSCENHNAAKIDLCHWGRKQYF